MKNDFKSSVKHYEKAYKIKRDPKIEIQLAEAYFKISNLDSSEALYARAVKRENHFLKVDFQYANVLMSKGDFEQAKRQFQSYLNNFPTDPIARLLFIGCTIGMNHGRGTSNSSEGKFIKEEQINLFTEQEYKSGAAFAFGKEVFSGNKIDEWTGIQYINALSKKDDEGNWFTDKLLYGDINSRFVEGPVAFTADEKTVYFTRSNFTKTLKEDNNLKIFKASFVDGKWQNLESFPYNSDAYSIGQVTLAPDGNTIYFISDMPGGYGGTDLYSSKLENGNWSKPENLGSVINSSGNEYFPFLNSDGALFYSSNKNNSEKSLDAFITYYNGMRWVNPECINLNYNGLEDEFSYSFDANNITSIVNSTSELAVKKGKPVTYNLHGVTRKVGSETPVEGVLIEITTGKTGEIIRLFSDANGNFEVKLKPEINYHIYFKKDACFYKTENISTKELKTSTDFFIDFEVIPVEFNESIVLDAINYDSEFWDISLDAKIEYDKLIQILRDNQLFNIEIGAHTDVQGNNNYNKVITEKRAMLAMKYLQSQGILKSRLSFNGYGEGEILNKCIDETISCTESENIINRRMEYKVLSNK